MKLFYCLSIFILTVLTVNGQQDTLCVILKKHKVSMDPQIKSYTLKGDTIFQTHKEPSYEDKIKLRALLHNNNYFIFLDKNNHRIMEGIWQSESMSGDIIIYWKDGAIKEKGKWLWGRRCGVWMKYDSSGKFIANEHFETCG